MLEISTFREGHNVNLSYENENMENKRLLKYVIHHFFKNVKCKTENSKHPNK
jgi:uncharacterized protein YdiU (UPF0061 family)